MVVRPKIPDEIATELREKHSRRENEPLYEIVDRVMTKAEAWDERESDVL